MTKMKRDTQAGLDVATALSQNGDPPLRVRSVGRANLLGAASFLALTLGVFLYQFRAVPNGQGPAWEELQWIYLLPIFVCLPIEPFAAGLRIWLACRLLHPGVTLSTCIKTDLANIAVSMLTPSQSGGGAAQIYMLHRNGVTLGTALTVCLLSFPGNLGWAVGHGRVLTRGFGNGPGRAPVRRRSLDPHRDLTGRNL